MTHGWGIVRTSIFESYLCRVAERSWGRILCCQHHLGLLHCLCGRSVWMAWLYLLEAFNISYNITYKHINTKLAQIYNIQI